MAASPRLHLFAAVLSNVGAFIVFITVFFSSAGRTFERQALEFQLGLVVDAGLSGSGWFAILQTSRGNCATRFSLRASCPT